VNAILKQLIQWPPTTSTVIGVGVIIFAADYYLTGSTVQAALIAGTFKIICPEDAAAVDQAATLAGQLEQGVKK
jgi:hypothetical protein